jgi:seryl-tRNA synthetase
MLTTMQTSASSPPATPAAPGSPAAQAAPAGGQASTSPSSAQPQATGAAATGAPTAREMYQALQAQRRELDRQLEELEDRREEVASLLRQVGLPQADQAGQEARLVEIDRRITEVEKQIASNDQALAQASAVPGAVVEEPPPPPDDDSEEVAIVFLVMGAVLLLPLVIAQARRIWKRGSTVAASIPGELWQRLTRLEESIDAVAVEVERLGEGQRFTNRVLAESRQLGAGEAQPIQQRENSVVPIEARDLQSKSPSR